MAENGFGSDVGGSQENLATDAINLDIEELDDAEYSIPAVDELPSLESILTEPDCGSLSGTDDDCLGNTLSVEKLGGSETASVGSLLSLNSLNRGAARPLQVPPNGSILRHVILKGISSQIVSASERVNAGLASAVASGGNMLVIGTSHGLVLGFDSTQTLRWCDQEARHQGSVSALCFNHDGTRLLAGFARGHILMIDSANGKVLRTLTEVHPPGTAVLHVKFTDSPTLALCSDSGGSVFELIFTRVMGVRGCDSKCLFSGSRGEVCTLEPLVLNHLPTHPLKNYTLVALATLSKVIVVCIRPRMRVVLTHPLTGASVAPPQVSWQLVVIQAADASRVIDPVLALARDTTVHFYQVCSEAGSRVRLSPLRRVILPYTISNLRWLNARSLAILDTQERLHLLDVRTQDNLETLDVSRVGISYASSHFKGLSTGGNVSKAMALAGERACYNTVITYGSQLLLLGTKSLHAICIRTWTERLRHLTMQRRFPEALALGLSFYQDKGKAVVGLRGSKQRRKQIARDKVCQVLIQYMDELNQCTFEDTADSEIVSTCVDYCVQLENTELLFGHLWDLVSESEGLKSGYLRALEAPLLDGSLPSRLPPLIAQQLIALYDREERFDSLQAIAVLLDVDCLDIHQVTTVCRQRCLWEALIHLQTSALGDFTAPIHQLVPLLQNFLSAVGRAETPSRDCIKLGNALLVYASCCLAGRGYPRGQLSSVVSQRAKAEVLRALLSQHSSLATDAERQYPYLRTLLRFDARGFLNVTSIAFQETEFQTEIGMRQRQRIIDILLGIAIPATPMSPDNVDFLSNDDRAKVLIFVANEVAECNVNLDPGVLNRLVDVLTTYENFSNDESSLDTNRAITRDRKIERENALLQLLNAKKLVGITDNTLLNLAQRANFLRVAELLYGARDDWTSVCRCMIADRYRHHEIWSFLDKLPSPTLQNVILSHVASLVKIDASRFGSLVVAKCPTKLTAIIDKLSNDSYLEFSLLAALNGETRNRTGDDDDDDDDSTKVSLTVQQLEKYLSLMCRHAPERLVEHINGNHGCRLDEALRIVRENGNREAEALMLEKLGNYQDAFDLLLASLHERLDTYHREDVPDDEVVKATSQLSGLCRRSAGNLDWMPLVEAVLQPQSDNKNQRVERLRGKLLRIVLETLSGTTALSSVLEQLLKHPLATSGTIGDTRQLLTGVLTHSRYEQILVETTSRLVSLELHETLKRSLRAAGRAIASLSRFCTICRQNLVQTSDYTVMFDCGHCFHVNCLGERKICYKCLNDKGWARTPVNSTEVPRPRPPERRQILPPDFMRRRDLSLRLGAPTVLPDLEGIF